MSSSAANSGIQILTAQVRRQIPVANYNQTYTTHGTHWSTLPLYVVKAVSASQAAVGSEPPPPPDLEWECEVMYGGTWDGSQCQYPNCPLIVDTARDGFRLTNADNGVRFDLNADGIAEQIAWTRAESDDAFLAFDRNGNGLIDNGTELFGNQTPTRPDAPQITATNGFEALRFAAMSAWGVGLQDGVIDRHDSMFSRLLLWNDFNHNGISEPDELQSLRDAPVRTLHTDYRLSKRVDRHGNEFRQKGQLVWRDGAVEPFFDVWLRWRD